MSGMASPYARGENRQQNSGPPVTQIAACVALYASAPVLIPLTAAAVVAVTIAVTGFRTGTILARLAVRGWRWAAASHDWDGLLQACTKEAEFTLAGVPADDRRQFRRELRVLCSEMAREAARADRERATGERNT